MEDYHQKMIEDLFSRISFALTEQGQVNPLYLIVLPDNSTMPIIINGQDGQEISLDMYSAAAHQAAKEMNATALMFVSEQYIAVKDKDDVKLQSWIDTEHPSTKNYLTITFMTSEGDCSLLISKIHKDQMGTKYTTNEREWVENNTTSLLTPWNEGN